MGLFAIGRQRAFTLIELLVVVLIIGILVAVAAPSFLGQQAKAFNSTTEQQLTVSRKEAKAIWTAGGQAGFPTTICSSGPGNSCADTSGPTLAGLLKGSEPQYNYADDSAGNTPATSTIISVSEPNPSPVANTIAFCEQSRSGVFFCVEEQENTNSLIAPVAGGSDLLGLGQASAAGTLSVVYSTGTSEADARCPLQEAAGQIALGTCTNPPYAGTYTYSTTGWPSSLANPGTVLASAPPSNLTAPSVSGSAYVGQTLTGSTGTWTGSPTSYSYQWEDCNSLGLSCQPVASGGNGASYTLQGSDDGFTVVLSVIAINPGGQSAAVPSAPTAVVIGAPANNAAPSITGNAYMGQTLTGSPGSWSDNPSSYTYQWQDCNSLGAACANISGATSSTYVVQSSDVADTIVLTVKATNAAGTSSSPASSTPSALVSGLPANTAAPQLTGNAHAGVPQSVSNGTWSGSPSSYAQQWKDCTSPSESSCANIAGATSGSYTPTGPSANLSADPNFSADAIGASSPSAWYPWNYNVTNGTFAVTNTWAASGSTNALQSSATFTGLSPAYFGTDDELTVSPNTTYFVSETADITALPSGGTGASAALGVCWYASGWVNISCVQADPTQQTATGVATDSGTLTSPAGAVTAALVYDINDPGSSGAASVYVDNAEFYRPYDDDQYLAATVAATNSYGTGAAALSAASAQVSATPVNMGLPSISGSASAGSTLSADVGQWTDASTYTYVWKDCTTAAETSCTPISGAVNPTYTVASTDTGSYIALAVSASGAAGTSAALLSPATMTYQQTVLAASPSYFWPMSDTSTPTVSDISGGGHNVTESAAFTNAMLGQSSFDPNGKSFTFAGSTATYVQLPTASLPTTQVPYTVELWFKTTSTTGAILGTSTSLPPTAQVSYVPNVYVDTSGYLHGNVWYDGAATTAEQVVSPTKVNDGVWHLVDLTVSGTTQSMYLDGNLVATGTLTAPAGWFPSYVTIGDAFDSGWPGGPGLDAWFGFNGSIADVAFYPSALSSAQVTGHYAARNS